MKVIVALAVNSAKTPLFGQQEREEQGPSGRPSGRI